MRTRRTTSLYHLLSPVQLLDIKIFGKYSDPEMYYITDTLEGFKTDYEKFSKFLITRANLEVLALNEMQYEYLRQNLKRILHTDKILLSHDNQPIILINNNFYIPSFADLVVFLEKQLEIDFFDYYEKLKSKEYQESTAKQFRDMARAQLQFFFNCRDGLYSKFNYCFFDIEIPEIENVTSKIQFQVIFQLYKTNAPKTCANFLEICQGFVQPKDGKQLWYGLTHFNRIYKNFFVQGGDLDGQGGSSIYGRFFQDEIRFKAHEIPGVIGMANNGERNTNGSQFYITLSKMKNFDLKYVAFGSVITRMKQFRFINKYLEKHIEKIYIMNAGEYSFNPQDFSDDLKRDFFLPYQDLTAIKFQYRPLFSITELFKNPNPNMTNLVNTIMEDVSKSGSNNLALNMIQIVSKENQNI